MGVPNLTLLANDSGSDKGDAIGDAHGYTQLYSFLFEQFRLEAFNMLEIGLMRGGTDSIHLTSRKPSDVPSIEMWKLYFPNAHIYGFDISDFSEVAVDKFTFLKGDMGSSSDLDRIRNVAGGFKLIVEDGSHAFYHQQFAFSKLFSCINPGGFYVIEDMHVMSPINDTLPFCLKTTTVFDRYLEDGRLRLNFLSDKENRELESQIGQIFVHRNNRGGCSWWGIKAVVIQKRY